MMSLSGGDAVREVAADARQRLAATLDALQQREGPSPATPSKES